MKIDSYAVSASSEREFMKVESTTTLIKMTPVQEPQPSENTAPFKLELSDNAKKAISDASDNNLQELEKLKAKFIRKPQKLPSNPQELKMRLLEQLLASVTKRRYRARLVSPFPNNSFSSMITEAQKPQASVGSGTAISLQNEHFFYERESVSYQAKGIINTADGKSISLDISMNMSREFASYEYTDLKINAVDPLVINYGGTAASLTGEKFAFDLDMDGKLDMISSLGEGSGFLALDKNGDGKINDGNELFGPQSGSGFSELRKYDSDGNNWIDENDDIWSELRIWSKDANGNDQLFSLLELDVGAIFLGDVSTAFSLTGDNNESYGTIQSTSFFLKESGGAGLVHHIDMTL